MTSAAHLLPEDRPEFERALDEALRTASQRPALAALSDPSDAERLRTMALSAATAIAACAAVEYAHFTGLRDELRHPADAPAARTARSASGARLHGGEEATQQEGQRAEEAKAVGGTGREGGGLSLAGAMGEGIGETGGAGLAAMASVLVPLLAGTAAVIFLLLGYLLRVMTPEPAIAAPMRGAGWVFAALAAAGIVVGMAELWLTALRNGAGARRRAAAMGTLAGGGDGAAALAEEVSRARAVWREALLEHGILPFLGEALADLPARGHGPVEGPDAAADGATSGPHAPARYAPAPRTPSDGTEERTPRLGYSGPEFSSRTPSDGTGEHSRRPRYSSPDYSSPDYGGPEHPPE